MIKENKFNQYGFPRQEGDIQGITLHEIGNINWSAQDYFNFLDNECKTSDGCHYICDSKEIIQVMPDNWAIYHTGKGKDWGTVYTIAIKICSSLNDDVYRKAQDNAVTLIKNLMNKYNFSDEMIFFHNDWDSKIYCPKTILDTYHTSRNFVYQEIKED